MRNLVKASGVEASRTDGRDSKSDELVREADWATMRFRADGRLASEIRSALGHIDRVPPQCAALAMLRCPLVVSTNYDDVYMKAALEENQREREMTLTAHPGRARRPKRPSLPSVKWARPSSKRRPPPG